MFPGDLSWYLVNLKNRLSYYACLLFFDAGLTFEVFFNRSTCASLRKDNGGLLCNHQTAPQ